MAGVDQVVHRVSDISNSLQSPVAAKLADGRRRLRWGGRWGRKEEISGPAAGRLFYAACATEPFLIAQKIPTSWRIWGLLKCGQDCGWGGLFMFKSLDRITGTTPTVGTSSRTVRWRDGNNINSWHFVANGQVARSGRLSPTPDLFFLRKPCQNG